MRFKTNIVKWIGMAAVLVGFALVLSLPVWLSKNQKPKTKAIGALIVPNQFNLQNNRPSYSGFIRKGELVYQKAYQMWRQDPKNKEVVGLLNQAIGYYQQAIKADPNNPRAYYLVGRLYDSVKASFPQAAAQAEAAYKTAYKKNKTDPIYLNTLALFLINQQKLLQARAYLENGLSMEGENVDGQLLLARTYANLGQVSQAVVLLSKALPKLKGDPLEKEVALQIKLLKRLSQVVGGDLKPAAAEAKAETTPTGTIDKVRLDKLPTQQADSRKLVIAAPTDTDKTSLFDESNSNAVSGKVKFAKGLTELEVKNPKVTAKSKIVTAVEEETNQAVFVKSKTKGSFTLAMTAPADKDLTVGYWIVEGR
ncbi:MAG: tetratricopeptide repeat protein [bacterium]|nr:tetratricopeptide repeat protein [bacterium]